MRDWIHGLRKAAEVTRPAASLQAIERTRAELGVELPDELRDLYLSMEGGRFAADVVLFPLVADAPSPSVVSRTRMPLPGLPSTGWVCFGERGSGEHLFAAQKSALMAQPGFPAWLQQLGAQAWLYGVKTEYTGELRLFRTLERLLWVMIPPAETEDFGENTYVRAMRLVEGAIEDLSEQERARISDAPAEAGAGGEPKEPPRSGPAPEESRGAVGPQPTAGQRGADLAPPPPRAPAREAPAPGRAAEPAAPERTEKTPAGATRPPAVASTAKPPLGARKPVAVASEAKAPAGARKLVAVASEAKAPAGKKKPAASARKAKAPAGKKPAAPARKAKAPAGKKKPAAPARKVKAPAGKKPAAPARKAKEPAGKKKPAASARKAKAPAGKRKPAASARKAKARTSPRSAG